MKPAFAALALLVALLITGFFYHAQTMSSFEIALTGIAQDRDALRAELRKLNARLDELQSRAAAAVAAPRPSSAIAEAGRAAEVKPPLMAAVARPGVTVAAPTGWTRRQRLPARFQTLPGRGQTLPERGQTLAELGQRLAERLQPVTARGQSLPA